MEHVKEVSSVKKKAPSFDLGKFLRKYNLFFLLVVFIAIGSTLSPKFFTVQNFLNLLQQSAVVGIISIGMTFVIIVAGIDLSVGSVLALAGMVMALSIPYVGVFGAVILGIIAGAAMGLINGLVTTKLKVPAFIATMAMMVAARGLALLFTDGKPVYNLPESIRFFGANLFDRIPVSGIIWIALTILAVLVLRYTTFGRKLYAIGGNPQSAHLSGINVNRYITYTYIICGALSALAGIVLASWLTVGQPTAGKSIELDAIAAVVLGGTSLFGGVGSVGGTFVGVLLMSIITNIFNLLGLSSYYQSIFMGVIIVLALVLNRFVISKQSKNG
ncbi:ribonucleotide-diphosphate reductase subunit alpha [Brevibacillus reuszeri]|uniref:Ribonucleotide-diphosphate reductase subunit alpha n=1 Tax=Brevibacillus reuszeri TaxID=54915 RepID=A0ABQ0TP27_9BACL|nr:ABC transporter permease [Brevibacillus reuszeri]MED1858687.1 ABC transporter permease [Brevibacillus reuszeri]GED69667.1 ribonucleotide-diphosphate reductase subunit alpha [Brevibacillus reuszeri]